MQPIGKNIQLIIDFEFYHLSRRWISRTLTRSCTRVFSLLHGWTNRKTVLIPVF